MDAEKIKEGVRLLLEGMGEDPQREGLIETPERIAQDVRGAGLGLYAGRLGAPGRALQGGGQRHGAREGYILLLHVRAPPPPLPTAGLPWPTCRRARSWA